MAGEVEGDAVPGAVRGSVWSTSRSGAATSSKTMLVCGRQMAFIRSTSSTGSQGRLAWKRMTPRLSRAVAST